MHTRFFTLTLAVAFLCAAAPVLAADGREFDREIPSHRQVQIVMVGEQGGSLCIDGQNFGRHPRVFVGGLELGGVTVNRDQTEILARSPGLPAGTYLLIVIAGNGLPQVATFNVALGSARPAGPQGDPGPSNVLALASFAGAIGSLTSDGVWVFAGPTATVSASAGQHLSGSAEAPLGRHTTTVTMFRYGLCYQSASGGPLTNFVGDDYSLGEIADRRLGWPGAASTAVPASDSYNVGFCISTNGTGILTLDDNGSVNGWVMVTP
jgi:hypothetical protein